MNCQRFFCLLFFFSVSVTTVIPQIEKDIIQSIELRNLGPAFMTGRIADIAKDPINPSTWYVATASGNVWKTKNMGTTWQPIFENYGTFSTGCIAIDPVNPNVIWLGTGENQSQRSVGWGDGVYKSLDAGKSWTNMGLKSSEHIGRILIDPRNPDIVLVASQGPLWKAGGERGVYRTEDGGKSWTKTLDISENTGASELGFDPANPDIIYASTYQRRRHVGILVAGGPESRIYKSTDNGLTWRMLKKGLPSGNLGRIGLAVSPQKPEVVYAHISGERGTNGFYRSEDYGESWRKMNDYTIVDPQYYGEIYCDPNRFDHVYVMDVVIRYTTDGGKEFQRLNTRFKHVDNHSLLFDENDPDYLMVGCDGGIYESWDRGDTWKYHDNLPITQFYRVGIDNELPFYNVYGGTQDNSTIYAPSQTISRQGITNADWNLALGGDGFQARIDPEDPNTVYCQSQYAGIIRYDKTTGQRTELQPQGSGEEEPLRWHWDSPLIISPHDAKRIYFAAQRVYRSDDRGDSWRPVSGDLSRGEDRNKREVMGKIWSPEAVWKNVFTSPFGTIVAMEESALREGLIVAGTDDGQIQITENGGGDWRLLTGFTGVPDRSYVADLIFSRHRADRIYAVFNNHKEGDFLPYILRSDDLGVSWTKITNGLEGPHACWTIKEDHVDENLLFAGTEFGLFATVDGGAHWYQMKGGLPTIPVRDLEIHEGENDLVCATFGRGMWILDDYSLLREFASTGVAGTHLFAVDNVRRYFDKGNKGYSEKGVFGDNYYTAPNPSPGPVLSVYLSEKWQTAKDERKETEKKDGLSDYPDYDQLKAEDFEEDPSILVTITDVQGNHLGTTRIPNRKGFHRVEAKFSRVHSTTDGKIKINGPSPLQGSFSAQIFGQRNGEILPLSDRRSFEVDYLMLSGEVPTPDYFEFYSAVAETSLLARETEYKIEEDLARIKDLMNSASAVGDAGTLQDLDLKRRNLLQLQYDLSDDETLKSRFEYYTPGILRRLRRIYNNMHGSSQITETHRSSYHQCKTDLAVLTSRLKAILN